MESMIDEIEEIVFDEIAIAGTVRELGERISRDYEGKELILICILKGAAMFTTDLARSISSPLTLEFIQASSYGLTTSSTGNVIIKKDTGTDLQDKHVLLVDTIIDTGKTMGCLFKLLSARRPASLGIVVLLDKSCKRQVEVPIAYKGYDIPDKFVVGYGLDYGEHYRNLPYIAVLKADG